MPRKTDLRRSATNLNRDDLANQNPYWLRSRAAPAIATRTKAALAAALAGLGKPGTTQDHATGLGSAVASIKALADHHAANVLPDP